MATNRGFRDGPRAGAATGLHGFIPPMGSVMGSRHGPQAREAGRGAGDGLALTPWPRARATARPTGWPPSPATGWGGSKRAHLMVSQAPRKNFAKRPIWTRVL